MAVSFTQLTEGNSTATAASYDTASVTPTNGATVFIIIAHARGAGVAMSNGISGASISGAALVSGGSASFASIAAPQDGIEIWKATGTGSAGVISIGFAGNHTGCLWKVVEASGDTGTVVQAVSDREDTDASPDITLASFGSATNALLFAVAAVGTTHTITSGYTELGSKVRMSDDSPQLILSAFYQASEDTSVTGTISVAASHGEVALELQESGGGGATWIPQVRLI
jgi:hypothetical protein